MPQRLREVVAPEVKVVDHHHHGPPFALPALDQPDENPDRPGVDGIEGFVEQDQVGLLQQNAGEERTLQLAGETAECPDLPGEATSGNILVFACATGLLVVEAGPAPSISHLAYAETRPEGKTTTTAMAITAPTITMTATETTSSVPVGRWPDLLS